MTDRLYAEYAKERNNIDGIWHEWGFVTYKIVGVECFIVDIFVRKSFRGDGKCRDLIEELCELARDHECAFVSGTIDLERLNANEVLGCALALGFKVKNARNDILVVELDFKFKG